jgi:hypothetical protein
MDITFVTTAKNDEHGYWLLKELGMPFATKEAPVKSRQREGNPS